MGIFKLLAFASKIKSLLQGKKTMITGAALVLNGLGRVAHDLANAGSLTGIVTAMQNPDALRDIGEGLGLVFIRSGIATEIGKLGPDQTTKAG